MESSLRSTSMGGADDVAWVGREIRQRWNFENRYEKEEDLQLWENCGKLFPIKGGTGS